MSVDVTGSRILIVDDVPENLSVLCQAIEEGQYSIQIAQNGKSAIDLATRSLPDLILLDVMMPDLDGFETCRRLKADERTRAIPVIFLTALNDVERVVEGFQAGGVDYMTKPFQKDEVLARIRTHLEHALMSRALLEKNEELFVLNTRLEEMVAARTQDLNWKVKELEGKDRITQQLLSLHTLEDTLHLVLEVVTHVVRLDRTIIYLCQNGSFLPMAAMGVEEAEGVVAKDRLSDLMPDAALQERLDTLLKSKKGFKISESGQVGIPILRGDEVLGCMMCDKHRQEKVITEVEVSVLESFARQAAVAIYDAQVEENDSQWQSQLDQVFGLDDVLKDADQLDRLGRE